MSSLFETIQSDLKDALKSGDRARTGALRFVISQIQYARIEKREGLTDDEVLAVLTRQAKGRRESIEAFEQGGRADLVAKESYELTLIESYLPAQKSEAEIRNVLKTIIAAESLAGPADLGRLMKTAMAQLRGQADGGVVNGLARDELQRLPD